MIRQLKYWFNEVGLSGQNSKCCRRGKKRKKLRWWKWKKNPRLSELEWWMEGPPPFRGNQSCLLLIRLSWRGIIFTALNILFNIYKYDAGWLKEFFIFQNQKQLLNYSNSANIDKTTLRIYWFFLISIKTFFKLALFVKVYFI